MNDKPQPNPTEQTGPGAETQETMAPSGIAHAGSAFNHLFAELPVDFGRFRILKLLGHGAMGTVYLGFDPDLNKEVAIKIPKADLALDPMLWERFQREARAVGDLSHPNICAMHQVGQVGATHYLEMEYVEGRPLSDFLVERQPLRKVVLIVRKLALALAHAHDRGIVHRDLKPANVMIAASGDLKLMDFGLARRFDAASDVRATQSGMIVGSPGYMSPEQVRAEHAKIGPQTDIYGLGVLFYELMTGSLPFNGPLIVMLGQIANQLPARPSLAREEIDSDLESLCLQMLAKQPDKRPKSMTEVVERLNDWLAKNGSKSSDAVPVALARRDQEVPISPPRKTPADSTDPLETQKQRVYALLEKHQYAAAIELLGNIVNLRDVRFEALVKWGRQQLIDVREKEKALKDASEPMCATAETLLKVHDYAEAVKLLSSVPLAYRSTQLREMLRKATECKEECEHLEQDIAEAIQNDDADSLPLLIKRLLKLKPQSKSVKKLASDLKDQGVAKFIKFRKGQRYIVDAPEPAFSRQQVVLYLLFIAGLFGGVSVLVRSYLANSGPPEPGIPMIAASESSNRSNPAKEGTSSHSVAVAAAFNPPAPPTTKPHPESRPADSLNGKWQVLFNGRDLTGWTVQGFNGWKVSDGILTGETSGQNRGWLMTDRKYNDFELELEYLLSTGSNSGIYLRAWPDGQVNGGEFCEIQLLDDSSPQFAKLPADRKTGAIFQRVVPHPTPNTPANQWHRLHVRVVDHLITESINGVEIVRHTYTEGRRSGHVGLQLYPTRVQFRNIRIREVANDSPVQKQPTTAAPATATAKTAPINRITPEQSQLKQAESARVSGAKIDFINSIGMRFRLIPPGEFTMGSPADEPNHHENETQRAVKVDRPFYLSTTEITQKEFETVLKRNPSYHRNVQDGVSRRLPVEDLTWFDAVEFCNELSKREKRTPVYEIREIVRFSNTKQPKLEGSIVGATVITNDVSAANSGYRLAKEPEWEYACRAGSSTAFHFGSESNGTQSNVNGQEPYGTEIKGPFLNRTTTVTSYPPNAWGLYDMSGNVWEWCHETGVFRGGCFLDPPWKARSALRVNWAPSDRFYGIGFRVVLPDIQSSSSPTDNPQTVTFDEKYPPTSRRQLQSLNFDQPEPNPTEDPWYVFNGVMGVRSIGGKWAYNVGIQDLGINRAVRFRVRMINNRKGAVGMGLTQQGDKNGLMIMLTAEQQVQTQPSWFAKETQKAPRKQSPQRRIINPPGEWNELVIVSRAGLIEVFVNSILLDTIDVKKYPIDPAIVSLAVRGADGTGAEIDECTMYEIKPPPE